MSTTARFVTTAVILLGFSLVAACGNDAESNYMASLEETGKFPPDVEYDADYWIELGQRGCEWLDGDRETFGARQVDALDAVVAQIEEEYKGLDEWEDKTIDLGMEVVVAAEEHLCPELLP
ncbi:hypothetical protein [Haloechinothrix salitolerans]|uniref:DUF732 domain-containing protein n=1 Tax=Haloechinothrix salitolerans TaxID=926830 RepID=A0ABW2C7W8_9PSEU